MVSGWFKFVSPINSTTPVCDNAPMLLLLCKKEIKFSKHVGSGLL